VYKDDALVDLRQNSCALEQRIAERQEAFNQVVSERDQLADEISRYLIRPLFLVGLV